MSDPTHVPVLLQEVLEYLQPQENKVYMDGNLGLGGHSGAILARCNGNVQIIGFDWDEEAQTRAVKNLSSFGERVIFVRRNFADVKEVLADLGIRQIDGLLLDLGLSSLQLDESNRGFSFRREEPLDMRMDNRIRENAADLVATASEEELADIFFYYGEERQAKPIARAICETRIHQPIRTSSRLADVIYRAIPLRFHPKKIHVATRAFQGLRIAVNRELDNLAAILKDGVDVLAPGGRFCVISFHSLEDRLVKRGFKAEKRLKVLTSRPVMAGESECRQNPRARSAKLRVAEKTG
jgi:16S rRNA (cytosine1402-N4)-methyltransferase